jgi:dihydroorotate dehydrogenase
VQVGTAIFRNPNAPIVIAAELAEYMASKQIQRVEDLVGRIQV